MPDMIETLLHALNQEALANLDAARQIPHHGESGRARENIMAAVIAKLLPGNFSVSTGFVIDARGRRSRQIDLVVYRTDYHPVFSVGGIEHFVVESVAAVIENKAAVTSRSTFRQAAENIKSVKSLDRTNRGKNRTLLGNERWMEVDPNNHYHQILGAILTEESLANDTLREEWTNFCLANERNLWPNFYADVRHFFASYLASIIPFRQTSNTAEAKRFYISADVPVLGIPPLINFIRELITFLRVTPLIDYYPSDYLGAPDIGGHSWALDLELLSSQQVKLVSEPLQEDTDEVDTEIIWSDDEGRALILIEVPKLPSTSLEAVVVVAVSPTRDPDRGDYIDHTLETFVNAEKFAGEYFSKRMWDELRGLTIEEKARLHELIAASDAHDLGRLLREVKGRSPIWDRGQPELVWSSGNLEVEAALVGREEEPSNIVISVGRRDSPESRVSKVGIWQYDGVHWNSLASLNSDQLVRLSWEMLHTEYHNLADLLAALSVSDKNHVEPAT
jgi:hypothetical protein